jgi:hypothetical protein
MELIAIVLIFAGMFSSNIAMILCGIILYMLEED